MFMLVRQALRHLSLERRRLAAIQELSKFDDRLLMDIGLRLDQLALPDFEAPRGAAGPRPSLDMPRPHLVTCG